MKEIVVCVPTTPGRKERLKECLAAIEENSKNVDYELFVFENELGGWVAAVREMMNRLPKDQLVVIIGDDCIPQPNWLRPLVDKFNEKFPDKDGLAQPDDGIWGGRIASYPVATAGYLLDWIYPGYVHYYADEELATAAREQHKYLYVPNSKVVHRGGDDKELWDETYEKESKFGNQDKLLFDHRRESSNHYTSLEKIDFKGI